MRTLLNQLIFNQFLAILLFSSFFAWAEVSADEKFSFVLCKNNQIVRTIRVNSGEEGCKTVYTKSGVDRIVGSGQNASSCMQFLNNIKGNLEEAAWSCREVSKVKITDLSKATSSSNED